MATPSKIQPATLVARKREVKFNQLDQEHYAVDPQAGYFYNLNETGRRIWELMATPLSVEALCAQLQKEYLVDTATCLRQVTEILTQLHEAGLIQTHEV